MALGVFYLLTLRGFWLFAAAFVASGVASYVLLTKQRDAVSSRISKKIDQPKPEGD